MTGWIFDGATEGTFNCSGYWSTSGGVERIGARSGKSAGFGFLFGIKSSNAPVVAGALAGIKSSNIDAINHCIIIPIFANLSATNFGSAPREIARPASALMAAISAGLLDAVAASGFGCMTGT